MRCEWIDLSSELVEFVPRVIIWLANRDGLRMQSATVIYNALAKLNCNPITLGPTIITILESSFIKAAESGSMRPQELAVYLYSMGKLIVEWDSLSIQMRRAVSRALQACSYKLNEQELGNVIWALGQMRIDFTAAPSSFREALFRPVVKRAGQLRVQALMAILQGLEHGQMHWAQVHPELRTALITASSGLLCSQQCESDRDALTVSLIYALGRLSTPWTSLPINVTSTMLESIPRLLRDTSSTGFIKPVQLCNGLACMSVTWAVLEPAVKESLAALLFKRILSFTGPEFSSVLWSLARMGVTTGTITKATDIIDGLKLQLEVNIGNMAPGELAWSLWALGKMEIQFSEMRPTLQEALLEATRKRMILMTAREKGVIFWAMGRMSIPLNELSIVDRYAIMMSIEELAMRTLVRNSNSKARVSSVIGEPNHGTLTDNSNDNTDDIEH
jgi:hypothetical protein